MEYLKSPSRAIRKVVEELRRTKMLQASAPLPGRKEEVRQIARKLNLPE